MQNSLLEYDDPMSSDLFECENDAYIRSLM